MRTCCARRLTASLVAAVAWGCARASGAGAVVRDSAGVEIVENRAPVDGTGRWIQVDSVPTVDIGGGADPHMEFGPDLRVIRLRGGSLVVGERGRGLRWFDQRGAWVRTVSREGSGPGEFRQVSFVALVGDSVLVYDGGQRRITVFDSAGVYGRSTTVVVADSSGEAFPQGALGDGRLLLGVYPEPAHINGLSRDSMKLNVGSPTGVPAASIGRFPSIDHLIEVLPKGISERRVFFARRTSWATFDSFVLVATNERFSFDWYDAGGHLVRSVRRPWTPVPVTDAEFGAQLDEWLEVFAEGTEAYKAKLRQTFLAAPRLKAKPPYGKVLVSQAGDVWVQEFGDPGQRKRPSVYSVFTQSGRWQSQVSVPAGVEPVSIGANDMVGTWRDEDDAIHIRTYRVRHGR